MDKYIDWKKEAYFWREKASKYKNQLETISKSSSLIVAQSSIDIRYHKTGVIDLAVKSLSDPIMRSLRKHILIERFDDPRTLTKNFMTKFYAISDFKDTKSFEIINEFNGNSNDENKETEENNKTEGDVKRVDFKNSITELDVD